VVPADTWQPGRWTAAWVPISLGDTGGQCLGAFAAGLVAGLLPQSGDGRMLEFLLLAGFCGSYTTVSSWSLQTLALVHRQYYFRAAANLVITTLLGLVAIAGGLYLARFIEGSYEPPGDAGRSPGQHAGHAPAL